MSAPQNFRSAFNGFNREDVVHYIEFLNSKHAAELNQLRTENEELREQAQQQPAEDLSGRVAQLEDRCMELEQLNLNAQTELEEAQETLRVFEYARLDARQYRDAAIMFGIGKKMNVEQLNDLLAEIEENTL